MKIVVTLVSVNHVTSTRFGVRVDIDVEHHTALRMLGDVAVGHPQPGIRDVQQYVNGLSGAQEHGVFPDVICLGLSVP